MTDYTAPTSKGDSYSSSTQPRPILPGYVRFRKTIDFGNAASNCFDFEEALSFLASPIVTDEKNRKGLLANPVYLVDPCQVGVSPIKTASIVTNGVNIALAKASIPTLSFLPSGGPFLIDDNTNALSWNTQMLVNPIGLAVRGVSAVNTAQTLQISIDSMKTILTISMVASGGTATLVVQGSVDNSNFITCDSIAAALTTQVSYNPGGKMTSAALTFTSSGLNPLGFRFIKITAGAAGAGFTTQLDIGVK